MVDAFTKYLFTTHSINIFEQRVNIARLTLSGRPRAVRSCIRSTNFTFKASKSIFLKKRNIELRLIAIYAPAS